MKLAWKPKGNEHTTLGQVYYLYKGLVELGYPSPLPWNLLGYPSPPTPNKKKTTKLLHTCAVLPLAGPTFLPGTGPGPSSENLEALALAGKTEGLTNLTKARPLGNDHISRTPRYVWVNHFPDFPFGGIRDRSLGGYITWQKWWEWKTTIFQKCSFLKCYPVFRVDIRSFSARFLSNFKHTFMFAPGKSQPIFDEHFVNWVETTTLRFPETNQFAVGLSDAIASHGSHFWRESASGCAVNTYNSELYQPHTVQLRLPTTITVLNRKKISLLFKVQRPLGRIDGLFIVSSYPLIWSEKPQGACRFSPSRETDFQDYSL